MMMNDKIPNADNAHLVLHSPFDIKVHKQTFINYLEVVISPEGVVEYAVPSHVEKLLQIFMSKYSFTDREKPMIIFGRNIAQILILKACPKKQDIFLFGMMLILQVASPRSSS